MILSAEKIKVATYNILWFKQNKTVGEALPDIEITGKNSFLAYAVRNYNVPSTSLIASSIFYFLYSPFFYGRSESGKFSDLFI